MHDLVSVGLGWMWSSLPAGDSLTDRLCVAWHRAAPRLSDNNHHFSLQIGVAISQAGFLRQTFQPPCGVLPRAVAGEISSFVRNETRRWRLLGQQLVGEKNMGRAVDAPPARRLDLAHPRGYVRDQDDARLRASFPSRARAYEGHGLVEISYLY